jgi:hypothetical protein
MRCRTARDACLRFKRTSVGLRTCVAAHTLPRLLTDSRDRSKLS